VILQKSFSSPSDKRKDEDKRKDADNDKVRETVMPVQFIIFQALLRLGNEQACE